MTNSGAFDQYTCFSGIDSRYHNETLDPYLSYRGYIQHLLEVELAIIKVYSQMGVAGITNEIYDSIAEVCKTVNIDDIVQEEERIHHDIRAVVNCINNLLPEEMQFAVHLAATSYDVIDSANAKRFSGVYKNCILPQCTEALGRIRYLSQEYIDTPMIGRTHLQNAIPITFGKYIARFEIRLTNQLDRISETFNHLMGKFSGPVGNHAALSLFCDDPIQLEKMVMNELGLSQCYSSSQIVPRENLYSFLNEIFVFSAIVNDLASGLRILASDAVDEVREFYDQSQQVASSSMPHKRNPIQLEKICSIHKVIVGLKHIAEQDICSWLDRDLSNSLSGRTYAELLAYFYEQMRVLEKVIRGLVVHEDVMLNNLLAAKDGFLAEPLYCILASVQFPEAHEKLRQLSVLARQKSVPVSELFLEDEEVLPYLDQLSDKIKDRLNLIIENPATYLGTYARN